MKKKTEQKEVFEAAIRKFGEDHQIDKAIEEMAELTKALLKLRSNKQYDMHIKLFTDICEEIADVEIMIDQLKLLFDNLFIEHYRKIKIERLESNL